MWKVTDAGAKALTVKADRKGGEQTLERGTDKLLTEQFDEGLGEERSWAMPAFLFKQVAEW